MGGVVSACGQAGLLQRWLVQSGFQPVNRLNSPGLKPMVTGVFQEVWLGGRQELPRRSGWFRSGDVAPVWTL